MNTLKTIKAFKFPVCVCDSPFINLVACCHMSAVKRKYGTLGVRGDSSFMMHYKALIAMH